MGCMKATKKVGRHMLKAVTPVVVQGMAQMIGIVEEAALSVDLTPKQRLEIVVARGKQVAAASGQAARGSLLRSTAEAMIYGMREGLTTLEEFGKPDEPGEAIPELE